MHVIDMPAPTYTDAKAFPAFNVSLLAHVPLQAFPGAQIAASDVCGYVSSSGREYAIIGFRKGTGFVEITDPGNATVIGYIDGAGINQVWRDFAVVGEYAYIVSDGEGVGIQVVDLTQIDSGVVTLIDTTDLGAGLETCHNISPGQAGEFVYLSMSNLNDRRGLVAVDVSDPMNLTIAGHWDMGTDVRCHDVEVVTWNNGPFAGREIALACAEGFGFLVGDVTDKSDMVTLATRAYPNVAYAHQGSLNDDQTLFFLGDELDEWLNPNVTTSTTYVFDVSNPANPIFDRVIANSQPSTDHNLMVQGDFVFEANYSSGLRVYNISQYPIVLEVGYFDTYPTDNNVGFAGAWGVFAGLPSGNILVSDQHNGLFVLDASSAMAPLPPLHVGKWAAAAVGVGILLIAASMFWARKRGRFATRNGT